MGANDDHCVAAILKCNCRRCEGAGDRSALAAMSIPFMFFARFLLIQRHVMNVANEELLGKAKGLTAADS